MLGLQRAARVARERAHEEAFRLVVSLVVVARRATVALRLAQLGPAARGVNGAEETRGVDEGFHDEDRVRVARLPIGAELCEHAALRGRTEVRHRTLRQEEETDVVGDESEAAALLIGPAYPLVAGPQMLGGRGENQHRHPRAVRVAHRVVQLLADRLHAAEIVPGDEQVLRALALLWRGELDAPAA